MITSFDIIDIVSAIVDEPVEITPNSPLVGASSLIDSMALVQICLALEERSVNEGFGFDWTSEKAMSTLNSIFKTPESLASEYNRQLSENQKK